MPTPTRTANKKIESRWDVRLEQIKDSWERKGFKVFTYKFNAYNVVGEDFPRTAKKEEMHIGLFYWSEKDTDIVFITKHNQMVEIPLPHHFEQLSEQDLKKMLLFSPPDPCCTCHELSTWVSFQGECIDCLD